jgi:hypothetical protein
MKNKIKGGFTIWARQTLESEIFYFKPAMWFKIWFYIVNKVNHKNTKLFRRGEAIITYNDIILATGATKKQVESCIKWLEGESMLESRKTTRGRRRFVVNYAIFQDIKKYKETKKETREESGRRVEGELEGVSINNNEKNENTIPPIIPPTGGRFEKEMDTKNGNSSLSGKTPPPNNAAAPPAGKIVKVPYPEDFLRFWEIYPKRVQKKNAFKAWKKLTSDEKVSAFKAVPIHRKSIAWLKDKGRYIPHPATWLNAGSWEDEVTLAKEFKNPPQKEKKTSPKEFNEKIDEYLNQNQTCTA